jgi:hypothetical protein
VVRVPGIQSSQANAGGPLLRMSATMSTSPLDAMRARYQRPWCTKRRARKPSIRSIIREAEKDGKKVSGATLAADGSVSLQFGEARTTEQANDLDKWMAKHNAN